MLWSFVLLVFFILAIAGPLLVPADTKEYHLADALLPPFSYGANGQFHLLGTERMGRDVLGLIVLGAQVSAIIGVAALGVAVPVGAALGMVAGYLGGRVDGVVMRIVDGWLSVPPILVAFVLATMTNPSLGNVILIMSIAYWPHFARLARGQAVQIRNLEYVDLAKVAGLRWPVIIWKHILPNVVNPVVVLATLYAGQIILFESTLGFLGLSVQPPDISWGLLTASGRDSLFTAWWIATFGGLAIMVVVLAINQLGDYLRDELDPRLRAV